MKRSAVGIVLGILVAAGGGWSVDAAPAPQEEFVLSGIKWRGQETNNWCWAACTEMVVEYLEKKIEVNKDIKQCDLVVELFPGADACCQLPVPEHCHKNTWPPFDNAIAPRGFQGYTAIRTDGPLSWDQIKHQLKTKKLPILFSICHGDCDGLDEQMDGHMRVMVGYRVDPGGAKIVLHFDPLVSVGIAGGPSEMSLEEYTNGLEPGEKHWKDYFGFTRVQ